MKSKFLILFLIPTILLAGCTTVSKDTEIAARNICSDKFISCQLLNKTCTAEGLTECRLSEFVFAVGNETKTIQCLESTCLHR